MIESPRTGIIIESVIIDELKKRGLKDKIFSITLDNATNNNVAKKYLKYCLHLPLSKKLF